MNIRYVLDHKKDLPVKNHLYIIELFKIIYNMTNPTWNSIINIKFSEETLQYNQALDKYLKIHMHLKLREIFRTCDIQKLRQPLKKEKDIITIYSAIAKMYGYTCNSYYNSQKKPIFVINVS